MAQLDDIKGPGDLRGLTTAQLTDLADQLRRRIIETVAETGGHLASNLGVVELTLALHTVFDSPSDRLIWDVGHQSYTHKLITGRADRFATLRQYGGLSGFPKRSESPHDACETGHSSTSISVALGIATARDLKGEKYSVVAVIGDGSLTAGMAFEALNHAGEAGRDLLVVLNDNSMSISANVGGLPSYLSRIRTDPAYYRVKADVEAALRKIPAVGPSVARAAERIKDSLKYLVVPGVVFEELGFTYLGPIDGHNIPALQEVFRRARQTSGPVLVHVITEKGRGYEPAVREPDIFHGIGPFDVVSGRPIKKPSPPSYTEVFGSQLVELAENEPRLVAVTAAMSDGTGLKEFARRFPERFFDVAIAEQHAVTFAAGLARAGLRPVVAIYSTFLQRSYDQIVHDVCLSRLPVIFAIDRAGLVGQDGETHQGAFDIPYLRHIPNMCLMAPADENELRHMLATALALDGPVAIRYPRGPGVGVPLEGGAHALPVGKAVLLRSGSDLAIIALGQPVAAALEASEQLRRQGISASVVNARWVKPLDENLLLELARGTGNLLTVEDGAGQAGFGSAVLETLARHGVAARVACLALPDEFVPHGSQMELRRAVGIDSQGIAAKAQELLQDRVRERRA
ncbi:MAG TPA: 1-deoxy-D-xylulose-5-phosphate synthase [Firmicutes bacterium]|jgi:1-deoxy-D-xylulose-5-phosphate synthase|nr:1-deoxy-D-xylulose-5-phosphate synthase [Bacillota bacterium]